MRRRRFIVFLIRKRLGLRNYEGFQFAGQKSEENWYFFGSTGTLWKMDHVNGRKIMVESKASLNWLVSDECKQSIRKNGKWWPQFEDEEE